MSKHHTQGQALTGTIRNARKTLRVFTVLISALMMNALMIPDIFAIQDGLEKERQANEIVLQGTQGQKLNQALLKIQEVTADKHNTILQRIQEESGLLDALLDFFGLSQLQMEELDDLEQLQSMIGDLHQSALETFTETEGMLVQKGLSDVILARHRQSAAQYQQQFDALVERLNQLLAAESLKGQGEAIETLNELMAPQHLKKSHQATDPNNMPWGVPNADDTRKPVETADELSSLTGIQNFPQPSYYAANEVTPEMFGQLGGPVLEDLAATTDIQLTDKIKAKAAELNDSPVEIYNWVRNNIEFIPSYGSIQGAEYTMEHGRGNAFDTASLLIALMRAANIPARYAYGTVDVPADKVMNWVGGVDVPQAAQQLLGQGGIPNVGRSDGSQITHIRMEHMWVEVWADYFPSRGAKHVTGDTWIPLDASFKQYEYTEGEDLATNVPFDAEALIEDLNSSITVNEAEGWVEGMDQARVEAALSDYQQQIETYINDQNPDATVGDVLGTQKVIVQEFQQLAAGLPYKLIARTNNYSVLPSNLRHKFRYTLGTEVYGRENSRLITFEQSLPELAGKKLAMSFKPATQDDEDLIASYLPEPDPETGEIDPSQLPNTLPGYLINLTGEFTSNGEVIESAAAGTMGGELYETLALWSPNRGWRSAVNHPIAGEYRAIGLDLQGANAEDGRRLENEILSTKAIFEGLESTPIGVSKTETVGNILYTTIYSYLAMNDVQDRIQAVASGVVTYRMPSYGLFSTSLQTSYWFGIPRNVSFKGLSMDVDHLETQTIAKNNDDAERLNFLRSMGMRASALEHLVPEQMFNTSVSPAEGISAVKALAVASAQGQKIWSVDQTNLGAALASINLSDEVESEIRNAVNAGKTATAHESPVAFGGGDSVGYILLDITTGSGAYKITSGTNGGDLTGSIAKELGWAQYTTTGASAMTYAESQIALTLGLIGNAISCYEDEIKTLAFLALIVIAAIALGLLLASGGGALAIPMVLRYVMTALMVFSTSEALAAKGGGRWLCDLKCQVYRTDDPFKGIIGFAYGSACGNDKSSTHSEAKSKAGEDVNRSYGPGHGYRHCTEPSFACKRR